MAYLNEGLQDTGRRGVAKTPIPSPFLKAFGERRTRSLLPVRVQFSPRIRGATANITGTITKVEIIWQGAVVTQVPAGDPFEVRVTYNVTNSAGGYWSVAITGIATDGSLPNYSLDSTSIFGGNSLTGPKTLNNMGQLYMPNNAVTLRITLWGITIGNDTTPPAQSSW
jgi:hypothetical protein